MLSAVTGKRWDQLAEAVRRRRTQMQLRQNDLEARGGPGSGTVRNIEQNARDTYAARTFTQLEMALEWPDGVVEKILDGTATEEELSKRVVRGRLNATLPGLTGSASAGVYVDGRGVRHVGNLPPEERAEQLERLHPAVRDEDEHAIFSHASALVPLLAHRAASSKASRVAVAVLLEVMSEIAGEMVQPGDTVTLDGQDYHP